MQWILTQATSLYPVRSFEDIVRKGVGSIIGHPRTLDPRQKIPSYIPHPSVELDARPRDGTCRTQYLGDAMLSKVRHPTANKISTTDYCDREIQRTGCTPQSLQQVNIKPSDKLSAELATVQANHQLLYRQERLLASPELAQAGVHTAVLVLRHHDPCGTLWLNRSVSSPTDRCAIKQCQCGCA